MIMDNKQMPFGGIPPMQMPGQPQSGPANAVPGQPQPMTGGLPNVAPGQLQSAGSMTSGMPGGTPSGTSSGMPGQPQSIMGGGVSAGVTSGVGMASGTNVPVGGIPAGGMPMVQQVKLKPEEKKDIAGLIKTIAIIVLSLIAVTFIGLFIWMNTQYNDVQSDVQGQIDQAVAKARDEQTSKLEEEFVEREKYPYKTFSGPIDYGQLTFEYPKTWSVYIGDDAIEGGDFNAYFNPIQVDTVSKDTINALRVTIRNESFDDVAEEYQKEMDKKDSNLTVVSTKVGASGEIVANRYTGTIPKTDLSGFIVTFKIRDKTAILQTDSVLVQAEFDKLLGTVTFNE